ncbi:HD domain-containing protein [Serinicoccus sp. LYQ131]|uniref:HD domain-containing protein n=1 Tax=Serinicoccus sp. LYQ131 TaxID=3378797 RepID=UPI00385351EC
MAADGIPPGAPPSPGSRGGSSGDRSEALLDRWLADAALLAPAAGHDRWLAEGSALLLGWSEARRSYHTTEHLAEVLAALDELVAAGELGGEDALLARTVAWYHDLAYDPRARPGSNEHRSATLARDHLHALGVEDRVVDEVEAGVLMTLDHEGAVGRPAHDALHDADLWILSAPPARYAAYREQVRHEYGHVPPEAFRAGRAAVMGAFAGRDRLYRTGHAHRRWTERARINLAAELEDLRGA